MAGIDRLAEALGRDNDLDPIERDNLCADAADKIKHLDDLVATAEAMQSFIGIMFGEGPDAVIPETVNAPVGAPIKIGDLMRSAATILARAKAQCAVTGVMLMDNGTQIALTLRRLPQGGYVVCDEHRPNMFSVDHFASASIDEALGFMRDKIKPIGGAVAGQVSTREALEKYRITDTKPAWAAP